MMSRRTLIVHALAAGAVVIAAGTTNIQAAEPFAGIPRASDILVRLDMDRLGSTPALAPIVSEIQGFTANYQNFVFEAAAGDTASLASVLKNFPGTVSVYEMGVLFDSIQGGEPQAFMVATGDFDAQSLHQRLTTSEGWSKGGSIAGNTVFVGPDDADVVLTMPNASTLLMSPNQGTMGDLISSYAAQSPSARDGALSSLVSQHAGSPIFIAMELPAEAKQMLAEISQNPPPQAAMIPGAPALLREAGALQAAVITLGGQGSDALLGLALNFSSAESAGRANSAFNNILPGLAMMAQMQAGNDPEMLEQINKLRDLRFTNTGSNISVQIPIPREQLQMAIAGAQEAAMGGMMGMMGGPPAGGQGQMNFYD